MKRSGWLCGLLLFSGAALAQAPDYSKVVIKPDKLAEGVYMFTGAGGNLGVSVGEDGVLIIDDQFAELAPKIQAAIAELSPKPVRFVVNTHYHFDHTGGNVIFGTAGAIIVAQDNVRMRMSEKQFIKLFNRETPPTPHAGLPLVTFDQDVNLHVNGDDLHVFHIANAHTDGDSLIMFKNANVLHMGDTLFNGFYPFIDVDGGGSINGMIAAGEKVLGIANEQTKIIPGHGPLASVNDVKAFHDMLVEVRDRVSTLIHAGKSVEEVVAMAPLKDIDAEWGDGFLKADQFVQVVYSDLKRTVH